MKKLFILPLLASLFSCWDPAYSSKIIIANNSNEVVYFYNAFAFYEGGGIYPDTTLTIMRLELVRHIRESHTSSSYYSSYSASMDELFFHLPQDTLSIYFFSKDTVDRYSWEEVCRDYKILRRYDLSLPDIEMLNFEVSYPPTEAMKNIKMWPPYGR